MASPMQSGGKMIRCGVFGCIRHGARACYEMRQDVNFSFRTAAKLAAALKMDFFPELRPQEASDGERMSNGLVDWLDANGKTLRESMEG